MIKVNYFSKSTIRGWRVSCILFSCFLATGDEAAPDLSPVLSEGGSIAASRVELVRSLDSFIDFRYAQVLANISSIEKDYRDRGDGPAPRRILDSQKIALPGPQFRSLKALCQRLLTEQTVDWQLLSKAIECLNCSPEDADIVAIADRLLKKPLEEDSELHQWSAQATALSVLGQQGTAQAVDILFKCAAEPVLKAGEYAPAQVLNEAESTSRHHRIAQTAAQAVLASVPKEGVKSFFEKISQLSPDENEPFGHSILVFTAIAERIESGSLDPWGPRESPVEE